jgi:hypothetical protein
VVYGVEQKLTDSPSPVLGVGENPAGLGRRHADDFVAKLGYDQEGTRVGPAETRPEMSVASGTMSR